MSGGGYPFWLKNQTNDADMEVIMARHETSKEKTREKTEKQTHCLNGFFLQMTTCL